MTIKTSNINLLLKGQERVPAAQHKSNGKG